MISKRWDSNLALKVRLITAVTGEGAFELPQISILLRRNYVNSHIMTIVVGVERTSGLGVEGPRELR